MKEKNISNHSEENITKRLQIKWKMHGQKFIRHNNAARNIIR